LGPQCSNSEISIQTRRLDILSDPHSHQAASIPHPQSHAYPTSTHAMRPWDRKGGLNSTRERPIPCPFSAFLSVIVTARIASVTHSNCYSAARNVCELLRSTILGKEIIRMSVF